MYLGILSAVSYASLPVGIFSVWIVRVSVCVFLFDFPGTARCTVQMVPHPFLSIPSSLSSEAEGKEG